MHVFGQDEEVNDILEYTFSSNSKINAVKITPAHISVLQLLEIEDSNIEVAIVGGDQLTPQQVSILRNLSPNIKIYNEYGPTEATVGCIVKEVLPNDNKILIGKPIANTTIYIVDQNMNLVPVGMPGEICIAGSQLAKGYLNRPELTEERLSLIHI